MRTLSTAVSALAIGLLGSSAARADRHQCQAVVKESIVTMYSADGCSSPVGICTTGKVGPGPLEGTSQFTALTLRQHGPDLLYSGELVITTKSGVVTLRDSGVLNTMTGFFFEIEHVVGGTGAYKEARGVLTSQGFANGMIGFTGTLTGRICTSRVAGNSRVAVTFDDEDSDE